MVIRASGQEMAPIFFKGSSSLVCGYLPWGLVVYSTVHLGGCFSVHSRRRSSPVVGGQGCGRARGGVLMFVCLWVVLMFVWASGVHSGGRAHDHMTDTLLLFVLSFPLLASSFL